MVYLLAYSRVHDLPIEPNSVNRIDPTQVRTNVITTRSSLRNLELNYVCDNSRSLDSTIETLTSVDLHRYNSCQGPYAHTKGFIYVTLGDCIETIQVRSGHLTPIIHNDKKARVPYAKKQRAPATSNNIHTLQAG